MSGADPIPDPEQYARSTRRSLLFLGLAALLLALGVGLSLYFRTARHTLQLLPAENAILLRVDFQALRRAGILDLLSGGAVAQEPEYKAFVAKTGFDYARDLNAAYISFHPDGTFFLASGKFDWQKLSDYAREQHGSCVNGLCRMPGSVAERKISWFAVRSDLLALAVSSDESAATRMADAKSDRHVDPGDNPVWVSIPPARLHKPDSFPEGTKLFAEALGAAEEVQFTLTAARQGHGYEANLLADCRNEQEAAALSETLRKITKVLATLLEKEGAKPSAADLAGVLTGGVFRLDGKRVVGRWPIQRAFLESLAGKS